MIATPTRPIRNRFLHDALTVGRAFFVAIFDAPNLNCATTV
jgi:hypothetical protein